MVNVYQCDMFREEEWMPGTLTTAIDFLRDYSEKITNPNPRKVDCIISM
jgi:hypothetical protein